MVSISVVASGVAPKGPSDGASLVPSLIGLKRARGDLWLGSPSSFLHLDAPGSVLLTRAAIYTYIYILPFVSGKQNVGGGVPDDWYFHFVYILVNILLPPPPPDGELSRRADW
mgnify:CR=1 FL=1